MTAAQNTPAGQVPVGYKQTEVGVIPEDWETLMLSEITDEKRPISYGIVQTGPNVPSGVRCLRVLDINNGKVNKTGLITTSNQISFSYKRTILQAGDLVMPLRGKVGDIGIIDNDLVGSNLTRGVALISVQPNWSPTFCRQTISSEESRKRLEQSMNGSALQEIPIATLRSFRVPLPPTKAEQEAISEALSDADALIESLEQLIAKKRQIKQGAMQELLTPPQGSGQTGKKRLPGFSGEWEVKTLGELAMIRSGGTPSTSQPQFWDGDIPWCTPTDITALRGSKHLGETSRKITQAGLASSSAELLPVNSIIMTSRATIGECAINLHPVSTNQGFKNFIPFDKTDVEFLFYLLTTQKGGFIGLCAGSTFLEIGKAQLIGYEVNIPPKKSEQTAIATILSDMDAEIAALETKLAKARQVKQGMMQELLTGRIRLV